MITAPVHRRIRAARPKPTPSRVANEMTAWFGRPNGPRGTWEAHSEPRLTQLDLRAIVVPARLKGPWETFLALGAIERTG